MRALVHGGGGSNGDWGVGVIKYLFCHEKREYDIYVGISTGALSLSFLAQCHTDTQLGRALAVEDLEKIYLGLKNSKSIYRKWFGWPVPLLWKNSVYNTEPLHKIVKSGLNRERLLSTGRKLVVGAVELGGEREYRTFDERHPQIVDAVLASSAFPVAFPPVKIDGKWWSDGGLRNIVPLKDAIKLGATDIDVIITSPAIPHPSGYNAEKANVFKTLIEATSAMTDEITMNDILLKDVDLANSRNNDEGYRKLNIRVFRPSRDLGDSLAFGADKKPTHRQNMTLGYVNAHRIAREYTDGV